MFIPKKAVSTITPLVLVSLLGACSSNNETADTLLTNDQTSDQETTVVAEPLAGAALAATDNDTDTGTTNNVATPVVVDAGDQNPIVAQPAAPATETAEPEAPQSVADEVETDAATSAGNQTEPEAQEANAAADEQETTPEETTTSAPTTPAAQNDVTYESASTPGFSGYVLNDTVEVKWNAADGARGYNVYRGGKYITTVWEPEFTDNGLAPDSYYYEIDAFDNNDNFTRIADALTVYVGVANVGGADYETPLPEHIASDYDLVFSEEFDTNTLDTTKWNTSYLWGDELFINSEEQYYVDIKNDPDFGFDPFTVEDGKLTIEAIRTPDNLRDKAFGQPYLSGVITSYDSFQFTYGYVEARARVPYGQGLWSAFWLLNAYYVDAKPEIDIMEHIGDNRDVAYHTYHYYDENGDLHSTESLETGGLDFTSQFHTYAVEWLPGKIIFYIDGVERATINDSNVSSQSMYIIANTALGGWWPGSPDETTGFPSKYEIDYIRAYQKPGVQLDAPILNDFVQTVPLADTVNSPPNRIPSPEQWPPAWPEL